MKDADHASLGSLGLEAGPPPFGRYERMLAMRYLRSKRAEGGVTLITIISFVGVSLAVFALITVMSVMNGFREELISKIVGIESHASVFATGLDPDTVAAMAEALEAVEGVQSATPILAGQVFAQGRQAFGPFVIAMSPEDVRGLDLVARSIATADGIRAGGSLAGFGVGRNGGDEIVLGSGVAARLGVRVGDTVRLVAPAAQSSPFGSSPINKRYVVGAIFQIGAAQYDGQIVFMPIEQARLFFRRPDATDNIAVRVEDPEAIDSYLPALNQAVGNTAFISTWQDANASFVNALRVERNVMRLILMMVVLIAALNIISGLVMLVKNKTRDIAILRTMGATRAGMMRVFFMAGALVGLLGTLSGLVLGVAFCLNIAAIQSFFEWVFRTELFPADIYLLSSIPAKLEWSEVSLVAGWGFVTSCLVTLLPAWWASRLDPVEALRYE